MGFFTGMGVGSTMSKLTPIKHAVPVGIPLKPPWSAPVAAYNDGEDLEAFIK